MLLLDRASIAALATPQVAHEAVQRAFIALDSAACISAQSMHLELDNGGELHIKGGWFRDSPWVVFKVATGSFPTGMNSGFTTVLDANTGLLIALIADDGLLTELRTAAAGALATHLLARPEARRVAVLGTGTQARYQVRALRLLRPQSDFTVWGRTTDHAHTLAADIGAQVSADVESVVRSSDIVLTVTSATAPVLQGSWLAPGTHVTAIGSDARGKRELDENTLIQADAIFCDDVKVSSQVGELQYSERQAERAQPLSGLVAGHLSGRRSNDDVTIADLCGLGIEDVAIAERVIRSVLPSPAAANAQGGS